MIKNRHKLFPEAGINNIIPGEISELVKLLESKTNNESDSNILAGFTYLGQMIAHDIVKSTKNPNGRKFNFASLELSSIYGGIKHYKNKDVVYQNKFRFSDVKNPKGSRGLNMDLLRKNQFVQIPDIRNDENIIISQLHLFWQKLHNFIISERKLSNCKNPNFDIQDPFEMARNIVVKTFQHVVVEDFLYNILDLDVYEAYINKVNINDGHLFFYSKDDVLGEVPLEFSHAAFRFGHSMVRSNYKLNQYTNKNNKRKTFTLDKLFNPKHDSIKLKHIVDWKMFFSNSNGEQQFANKINESIVNPMENIPNQRGKSIISMNLNSGYDVRLPSGLQVLKYIQKYHRLSAASLKLNDNSYKVFDYDNKFSEYKKIVPIEKLPLWLYILLEAKTYGQGGRLGKLGSVIVAEVIFKSIYQAEISIFKNSEIYLPESTMLNRLNIMLYDCINNSNDVYNGYLDDFRRFKMIDVINYLNMKI